jgi:hypothetical protein
MRWFRGLFPPKHFPDGREMTRQEESEHWIAVCSGCGNERSIASFGGARYRAQGSPTKLLPCAPCGSKRKMKVVWRPPT